MQDIVPMCSFDSQKSTKGASKVRRDLINGEIANLRDLLPLPATTRQRLSQLQLMALVCVYVRKSNYFQQVFKHNDDHGSITSIGFSKALSGFLMMMTQNGKLLYISDNAAEYLGHSMEDLLIHGDSVYDIIDKADHQAIQTELLRSTNLSGDDTRIFLCRMNVSRNARRQMRFGDQKVVLVKGHYVSYLPLCSRNEPVFLGTCTPIAMPETRECVVQGATNVFTSIHTMDMKFIHLDKNGEFYLGYTKSLIHGMSWYQLLHWDCMREAQSKHRLIAQSEQDRSCILLLRLQCHSGSFIWVHCVLQVKDNIDSSQQPVIVCTNQVLTEREAAVMRTNSWLYHYYTVQSKLQYGLAYENNTVSRMSSYYPQMMAYPSAHPTTHLPHSETSPYSSFLHSNSITAINGSQLSTASPPSSHYPYSSHPVSYHQLSMESSPFRAGFVPDNPNSHTPPYTNQSYLTSSIPTEECSIPLPSALTSGYTSLSYDKGDTHMKDTSETQPKHSCLKTSDYQSANHDVESGASHSPKGVDLVDSPRLKRPLCDIDPSATYLSNPFKRRSTFIRSHSNNFLEAFSVTDSSLLPSGSALVSENGSAAALASVPSVRRHFPFSQKLMQLGQRTQELEEISTSHVDTLQKVPDMHSPDISPPHSLYTPTPENSPSFFCYPPNHSLGYRSYAEYDESTKRLSDPYSKIEPLFKLCPSALIKTEAVSPESPVDRSRYKWKNPWSDLELKPVSSEQLSVVKEEDGGGPGRLLDLDSIPRSCRVSRQTPNEPVQSAFRSPSYHLETKGNSQDSG